jgi:hypothetical protein
VAGPPRRRGALGILLLGVCAATAAGFLAAPPSAAPADEREPGCPSGFPRLVTSGDAGLGLLVCSDEAGTRTLLRNETPAVWVVEPDSPAPVGALPLSRAALSFADLVEVPDSYLPSDAAAVVPVSPERIRLTVDPALTIAPLAHDQLVDSLGTSGGEALRLEPSVPRRALTACLLATLEHVESPGSALAHGAPAAVLAEAAAGVDAGSWSDCGRAWLEAKAASGWPEGQVTSFVSDIVGWDVSPRLTERGEAAAALYHRLQSDGEQR